MTLGEKVIQFARSFDYVRELTGHNDHPIIDRMMDYLGLPHNLSWCLAFVVFCYHCAVAPAANPLPKIARCALFWQTVQDNDRYVTFDTEDVAWGVTKAKAGDVMIFSHSKVAGRKDWNGHAAIVIRQITPRRFETIEGNTNKAGSREGDGVYAKERGPKSGTLALEGFVRCYRR